MDITLEEFETFAIARLKRESRILPIKVLYDGRHTISSLRSLSVLTNIHSLFERSLPPAQLQPLLAAQVKTHLSLSSNTARNMPLDEERRADELGHWILRLAFCRSPDLREKFVKTETELFKQRFETDDRYERAAFLRSLEFDWGAVSCDSIDPGHRWHRKIDRVSGSAPVAGGRGGTVDARKAIAALYAVGYERRAVQGRVLVQGGSKRIYPNLERRSGN
jgi:hypothetical protein